MRPTVEEKSVDRRHQFGQPGLDASDRQQEFDRALVETQAVQVRRVWGPRALQLLRSGPKSTLQLRRDADILSPAARVLELKRRGFDILTQWVHQPTDCGKLHRVALYVLMRESGGHA